MSLFENARIVPVTPPETKGIRRLRTLEARSKYKTAIGIHELEPGRYGLLIPPTTKGYRRQYLLADHQLVHNLTTNETYARRPGTLRAIQIPLEISDQFKHLNEAPI